MTQSREDITRSKDDLTKSRESLAKSRESLAKSRESLAKSRETLVPPDDGNSNLLDIPSIKVSREWTCYHSYLNLYSVTPL